MERAAWSPLPPWERYRLRVLAVAATWTAPVFCLESAAVMHGLPVFGEPRRIHLMSSGARTWVEGDVVVHGWRDGRVVVSDVGHATTSVMETTVDLCRVLPPAYALAVADAAARRLTLDGPTLDLPGRGREQANRRGRSQLDWIHTRVSGRSESVGESVSRAVIEWLGYEEPELQHEFFHEGAHDRSDFYWPRLRIVGESDGYGKYDASTPAAMKAHFISEKRREDRLRRHEGGFARWEWADTIRSSRLDGVLRGTGLAPVRRPQFVLLVGLGQNPRSFA